MDHDKHRVSELQPPASSLSPSKMNPTESLESSTTAEMEETIARISSHKGVEGVMIMDRRGMIQKMNICI